MKRLMALAVAAGFALAACSTPAGSERPVRRPGQRRRSERGDLRQRGGRSRWASSASRCRPSPPPAGSPTATTSSSPSTDLGYTTDLQYAEDDIPTQVSQIENMITKGAKVLVIAAIDGTTLTDTLQKAADAKIKVLAYDRLIRNTPNVDYYATFDNFKVGVLQAGSIVDALGLNDGKGPFNIELFAGSPDDNNAGFFFNGAMSHPPALHRQRQAGRASPARPSSRPGRHAPLGRRGRPGPDGQHPRDQLHRHQRSTRSCRRTTASVARHHRLAEARRLLHPRQARSRRHRPGRRAAVGQVDPRRRTDSAPCSRTPAAGAKVAVDGRPVAQAARPSRSTTPRPTTTA